MSNVPRDVSPRTRVLVRAAVLAVVGGLAGVGVFVLAVVPPTADSYYLKCQFHTLTGLHCPGCGTTRALHAALNGRFLQALVYNALAPFLIPYLGWELGRSLWAWVREKPVAPTGRRVTVALWVLLVLMVVYAVLRNVPVYPLSLLAPHEL